ncbi:MAG TPA: hypothetical protein DCQ98_10150 [Planctomycetaceae bacterium]|nr:hypothetical protein [Planctomycetaceae bacterium]
MFPPEAMTSRCDEAWIESARETGTGAGESNPASSGEARETPKVQPSCLRNDRTAPPGGRSRARASEATYREFDDGRREFASVREPS